jgi:carbon starvation protein
MLASLLIVIGIILFILAYRIYGRMLSRKMDIDDTTTTPAHAIQDGVDYVPAKSPVLLGHHFASIAGAGPILGPIIASAFGWLPVLIWIIIGGIFFGGVHDMGSLVASIRHQGRSIGQIIEDYLGKGGKMLFLIFAYLTMILVIAVFCKIVATTFVSVPAVATSSFLFILVALAFGFFISRRKLPLGPTSIIGVVLLFSAIYAGNKYPMVVYDRFVSPQTESAIAQLVEEKEVANAHSPVNIKQAFQAREMTRAYQDVVAAEEKANTFWIYILLIYVFIAATTPVWILLQPRDYLNSFLLYALVLGGIIGIFFAGPVTTMPSVTGFQTNLGYLFPVLFVTVACGAISGFHSLVASGTTAKQLNKESDAKAIGYGGMLIESVLAIVALVAAATLARERFSTLYQSGDFIAVFSEGVGWFMSKIPLIGISQGAAITFAGLAVSAFALTSLDTCTRLARFALQEFFDVKKAAKPLIVRNRYMATGITVAISAVFIFSGSSGAIWPIFGSANQLLAALALLAVSVWLANMKKKNWFTVIPMIFMYAVTLTALVTLMWQNLHKQNYTLVFVGVFLFIVAVILAVQGGKKLWGKPTLSPQSQSS